MIASLLLIIITIFCTPSPPLTHQVTNDPKVPPLGVFLVAGCGADFLINLLLTLLGYVAFLPQYHLSYALHTVPGIERTHALLPFPYLPIHSALYSHIANPTERETCSLTQHSFFPGHIHAFYIEYVYIKRRDEVRAGIYNTAPVPGVYSQKVQNGGHRSMPVAPGGGYVDGSVGGGNGYGGVQGQEQGYGTVR